MAPLNSAPQRTVLLATDAQNSVVTELAGDTNRMAFSAYGHQSAQQAVMTRLGFNGELCEVRIGWYVLGNGYRAYNPCLMHFHSPDSLSPFGLGGVNAYMYCGGNPVMNKDPTGHSFFNSLFTNLGAIKNSLVTTYQTQRAVGQNPVTALISTVSGNRALPNRLGTSNSSVLQPRAQLKPMSALPTAKNGGLHHNVVGGSSTPGSEASYNGSGLGTTSGSMWDRLAARDRSTPVAVVSPNYGRSTQTAVVKPSQSAPAPAAASAPPTVRNGAAIQPSRPEQRWDTGSAWSGESGPSDWSSTSSNASIRGNRR